MFLQHDALNGNHVPNATSIFSPSTPAVSTKRNVMSPIRPIHSRLSRVVPATGVTIAPPGRFDGFRYPIRAYDEIIGYMFSIYTQKLMTKLCTKAFLTCERLFFFLSLPSLYDLLDSLHISRLNSVLLPASEVMGGHPRLRIHHIQHISMIVAK